MQRKYTKKDTEGLFSLYTVDKVVIGSKEIKGKSLIVNDEIVDKIYNYATYYDENLKILKEPIITGYPEYRVEAETNE